MYFERSWAVWVVCLSTLTLATGCQYVNSKVSKFRNEAVAKKRTEAAAAASPIALNSTMNSDPSDEQKLAVQMAFARSLERNKDYESAGRVYKEIILQDSAQAAAHHRLAILLDMQGKHESATDYYRLAIQHDPNNADVYADLGYSFYLQNRWPEAERNLRQALQIQSDLSRAHNNFGLILARTSRQDEALVEFQRAGCTEAEGLANMTHALLMDQKWSEARQQCQAALACHAVPAELRQRLVQFNEITGRALRHASPLAQSPVVAGVSPKQAPTAAKIATTPAPPVQTPIAAPVNYIVTAPPAADIVYPDTNAPEIGLVPIQAQPPQTREAPAAAASTSSNSSNTSYYAPTHPVQISPGLALPVPGAAPAQGPAMTDDNSLNFR